MNRWLLPLVFLLSAGVAEAGTIKKVDAVFDGEVLEIDFQKEGECEAVPLLSRGKNIEYKLENCKIGRPFTIGERGDLIEKVDIKPVNGDTLLSIRLKQEGKVQASVSDDTIKIVVKPFNYVKPEITVSRIPKGERIVFDLKVKPLGVSYLRKGNTFEIKVAGVKFEEESSSPYSNFVKLVKVRSVREGGIIDVTLFPGVKGVELTTKGSKVILNIYGGSAKKALAGTVQKEESTKVSLNFTNADVRAVVKAIAEVAGVNVVFDPEVKGNVSINFKKPVYWKEALRAVLDPLGLTYEETKDYMRILPKTKIIKQEITEPVRTFIVPLNYADAKKLKDDLEKLIKGDKREVITVNKETNSLILKVTESHYREIMKIVKKVDRPVKQVLVKAKIVQVENSATKDLGFSWFVSGYDRLGDSFHSTYLSGSYGFWKEDAGFTQIITPDTFGKVSQIPAQPGTLALGILNPTQTLKVELALKALEVDGNAKTVSSPKVLTLDNEEATIEQGIEIPYREATVGSGGTTTYQLQFKKASLILKVKPHVTNDGQIIMDIEVRKDSPNPQYGGGTAEPAIDTRNVKSRVKVSSGETVVIGGIYEKIKQGNKNAVPIISQIPLLGWLFKNEHIETVNRKLLIFITPEIVE
ncbi:type IV pilus secretin PilQ [Phorcysia thermohydrogeniphila]|uniref:Type IV pilus assembly protein PilQ n=1 Tax=Phorcysia thermohydrogeniphila TaxID=936138 RepID=A0A4R1GI15_9BACT|nr:type IV pilus secretin PilQ [Phorcysia thermohydrogeniphila]TCK06475.1 type IV pilus assembly protein PilQ [Phorcysia thermohydrogeniphila]